MSPEPAAPRNMGQALLARAGTDGVMVFHDRSGARRVGVDELLAGGAACAAHLHDRGIGTGDAVGVLGPNRPEWAFWTIGVWLAGAAVVERGAIPKAANGKLQRLAARDAYAEGVLSR
jgi:acyl-CoA synthetase (AMP-forming)/AMP-acid ligase II